MKYNFISIRGTNGAGKSTLVRKLLSECDSIKPIYINGRKKPAYYKAEFFIENDPSTYIKLGILGHYEGEAGGGCDNLSTTDQYYELAYQCLEEHGVDCVIGEGMIFAKEFKRIQDERLRPIMLHLNVPEEECFKGVQDRRITAQRSVGRNEEKLLDTIRMNHQGVESSCRRLHERGIPLLTAYKRDEYWDLLQRILGEDV